MGLIWESNSNFWLPSGLELLPLGRGDGSLVGGRGPWRFRGGHIEDDLLQWLQADPLFQDPAGWHSRPWNWTGRGKNWYAEDGHKIQVAGKLGPCQGTSLLTMSLKDPFPSSRAVAFRRAFLAANSEAWDQLHAMLVAAVPEELDAGANAADLRTHPREWLAAQGTLQFHLAGEATAEPWHWDGGASILHFGLTLWGARELACRFVDDSEVRVHQVPGFVYLANLTSFFHQVSHPSREQQAQLLHIPRQGECGVSIMMRTALFRRGRVRKSNAVPNPKAVFDAATRAVVAWLHSAALALPSLEQCEAAAADGGVGESGLGRTNVQAEHPAPGTAASCHSRQGGAGSSRQGGAESSRSADTAGGAAREAD